MDTPSACVIGSTSSFGREYQTPPSGMIGITYTDFGPVSAALYGASRCNAPRDDLVIVVRDLNLGPVAGGRNRRRANRAECQ